MYLKIFNKNYINVELLKTYIKKNYDFKNFEELNFFYHL